LLSAKTMKPKRVTAVRTKIAVNIFLSSACYGLRYPDHDGISTNRKLRR
jgi:hypothetical protein